MRARDLTRGKVIEAGLRLLDREGVEAVSMRAVAKSLRVTPMALYNHVDSKDDLLRAIASYVLDKAMFDGGASGWRDQVVYCFSEFRALCLRHPGLSRLLEAPDIAPTSAFAPMEITLSALGQAGLSELDSVRTYFTLVSFTLMQATYQSRGDYVDLEPNAGTQRNRIAGSGFKVLEQMELPRKWDFDTAFEFGIGLILDGVESAVRRRRA